MDKAYGSIMEVARIQSEINRLFDNLLDLDADEQSGGAWIPNADIFENDESLVVEVELPGVDPRARGCRSRPGHHLGFRSCPSRRSRAGRRAFP